MTFNLTKGGKKRERRRAEERWAEGRVKELRRKEKEEGQEGLRERERG